MMKTSKIAVPAAILFFAFVLVLADRIIFNTEAQDEKEYQYVTIFSEVVAHAKTNYVEEINPAEKFPGAFSSMLSSLDPFSAYLDVDKTKTYCAYLTGRYCDCGIDGVKAFNYFLVTNVIPDSPAGRAGVKHGDLIKSVNGISLYSQSPWEMYLSFLSPEPQTIQLGLFDKKNPRNTQKIELQTRFMDIHTTITPIRKDILLVKLSRFDAPAAALLKEQLAAYGDLRPNKNTPLKLIIDLRTYRGGDIESFKEITGLFFKDNIALTLQFKKSKEDIFPKVKAGLKEKNLPEYKAAVIINSSTRMFGELLAAIFKDPGTGTAPRPNVALIGTKTPGFIAHLTLFPLPDSSSLLITEGLFLLNGKPVAPKGIEPDIVIKEIDRDPIMDKCISMVTLDAPGNPGTEKKDNGK